MTNQIRTTRCGVHLALDQVDVSKIATVVFVRCQIGLGKARFLRDTWRTQHPGTLCENRTHNNQEIVSGAHFKAKNGGCCGLNRYLNRTPLKSPLVRSALLAVRR